MLDLQKFKDTIKNLKVNKPYTKEFLDKVNQAIEKRFTKCEEDDNKRTSVDMNKRFDV